MAKYRASTNDCAEVIWETIYDLSYMAGEDNLFDEVIEDSRELFYLIRKWAKEFESKFDIDFDESEFDYIEEIDKFYKEKKMGLLNKKYDFLQKSLNNEFVGTKFLGNSAMEYELACSLLTEIKFIDSNIDDKADEDEEDTYVIRATYERIENGDIIRIYYGSKTNEIGYIRYN